MKNTQYFQLTDLGWDSTRGSRRQWKGDAFGIGRPRRLITKSSAMMKEYVSNFEFLVLII